MKFWLIFTGFFCKKWLNWATHKGTMVKKVTKRFGSKMYHFYNKISYSSNEVEILAEFGSNKKIADNNNFAERCLRIWI